jgi:diguanylate cyclase (GGDEF)-like protein/PAS domain S-box-containing protein
VSKVQRPAAQALYEKLFACSPDAIVVVDDDGHILEVNPQVESLFGYTCSELLGRPVEILIPERLRSVHATHRRDYGRQPHMRPMGTGLELYGRRKNGGEFPIDVMLSPVDSGEEQCVLGVIRDITERKRLQEAMQQLVSTDDLTGLGNYRRLQDEFQTAAKWLRRTGRSSALLVLDVDGLKKINDTFGHVVGSGALCRLANALQLECRSVDIAVRYGGDEFAVILPDAGADGAQNLARRIASRLAEDGGDPPLSFSYGVAVYPDNGKTLHELLAFADLPLYEMKKSKH